MARVLVLTRDLLFGSRVQSALSAAGHEVELVGDGERVSERLAGDDDSEEPGRPARQALLLDLTAPDLDGLATLQSLRRAGTLSSTPTLAFYSHVDGAARERAEAAGVELVVPRSRMAREAPELVARLLTRS